MNDDHLLRYARHILLDEFGIEGQEKLINSKVLIIGAGGLGSPAAFYLAAAGVGNLTLVDDDIVELSNLQRQILHTTKSVDTPKAISGKQSLNALNPLVNVETVVARVYDDHLHELVAQADIVLDCCDNFATRHAVNLACVNNKKPLVSGAAIRFSGQVSVFDLSNKDAPCYNCLFPRADQAQELRCATTGVLGPLVGIIGSMQAAEAIKVLSGMGQALVGRLLCIDAMDMNCNTIRFRRDPECEVCKDR